MPLWHPILLLTKPWVSVAQFCCCNSNNISLLHTHTTPCLSSDCICRPAAVLAFKLQTEPIIIIVSQCALYLAQDAIAKHYLSLSFVFVIYHLSLSFVFVICLQFFPNLHHFDPKLPIVSNMNFKYRNKYLFSLWIWWCRLSEKNTLPKKYFQSQNY